MNPGASSPERRLTGDGHRHHDMSRWVREDLVARRGESLLIGRPEHLMEKSVAVSSPDEPVHRIDGYHLVGTGALDDVLAHDPPFQG